METNKQKAVANFMEKRYNCCQSVVCTYAGRYGAVTGMFLVIGLYNSAGDMEDPLRTKMDTYEKIRKAAALFREKKGSVYCRDLLTQKGPQPLPCCAECVETALEVLGEMGIG